MNAWEVFADAVRVVSSRFRGVYGEFLTMYDAIAEDWYFEDLRDKEDKELAEEWEKTILGSGGNHDQ